VSLYPLPGFNEDYDDDLDGGDLLDDLLDDDEDDEDAVNETRPTDSPFGDVVSGVRRHPLASARRSCGGSAVRGAHRTGARPFHRKAQFAENQRRRHERRRER
jgi:hypothetical protein